MSARGIIVAGALALGLLAAVPAQASERLLFDHRLSPPLAAAFADPDPDRIAYDARNPTFVTDLVEVRGTSAKDWTEALVIISRKPAGEVRTAAAWSAELQGEASRRCASTFTTVAQDARSITFERRSTGCAPGYPPIAIYRAVGSGKSLFLLAAMARDGLSDESLRQYRAVLASARIE